MDLNIDLVLHVFHTLNDFTRERPELENADNETVLAAYVAYQVERLPEQLDRIRKHREMQTEMQTEIQKIRELKRIAEASGIPVELDIDGC